MTTKTYTHRIPNDIADEICQTENKRSEVRIMTHKYIASILSIGGSVTTKYDERLALSYTITSHADIFNAKNGIMLPIPIPLSQQPELWCMPTVGTKMRHKLIVAD